MHSIVVSGGGASVELGIGSSRYDNPRLTSIDRRPLCHDLMIGVRRLSATPCTWLAGKLAWKCGPEFAQRVWSLLSNSGTAIALDVFTDRIDESMVVDTVFPRDGVAVRAPAEALAVPRGHGVRSLLLVSGVYVARTLDAAITAALSSLRRVLKRRALVAVST